MSWDRYTAGLCASAAAMRLIGAVSLTALGMTMLPNGAIAQSCEVDDITKASSATTASNENFKKMIACIRELQARLDKVQNASGTVAVRATNADTNPDGIQGLSGTFDRENEAVRCPPGSFVSAIQGFTSDHAIHEIKYSCRSLK